MPTFAAIEASAGDIFDARTARLTIVDLRKQQTLDAELENELLAEGHALLADDLRGI